MMENQNELADDPNLGEADYDVQEVEEQEDDYQERRYTYIIDPDVQFRFLFTWFGMLLVYIFLVLTSFYFTQEFFLGDVPNQELQTILTQIFSYSSVFVIVLTVLFAMFSILISHKIAGPAYNICQSIQRMKEGNVDFNVQLRQSDYLQDVAKNLNNFLSYFRERKERVQEVQSTLQELKQGIKKDDRQVEELISLCESMETDLTELSQE